MVNWVTHKDAADAVKTNVGVFAIALMFVAGMFAGARWWISGRPLRGEPDLPQPVRAVVRGGLFLGAFGLAYVGGTVGWVAAAAVFGMAGLGWWMLDTDED